MKRTMQHLTAVLCLCLLLVMTPMHAWAESAQPPKDEVVYAKLFTDGSVNAAYVINGFKLGTDTVFTDYGDYGQVHNLSTLDQICAIDGAVTINAAKGQFYYQGDLNSPELPWTIAISYLLDGKPITAQQAAGASGWLKIVLDIQDNPYADSIFTDNYSLQIEMTLDTEKCTNIMADGATIALSGKNKIVNFIRMPGSGTSYSVSMHAENFEMDGIQIAGIPFSINIDMPDINELTGDLSKLQDAIAALNGGAELLVDGGGQLKDGFAQFHTGLMSMQTALNGLKDGLCQIVGSNVDLHSGLVQIEQALLAIQGSLDEYKGAASDLSELLDGSTAVSEGITQLSEGLDALDGSFDSADQGIYEQSGHAYTGLQQANEATILSLNQQIEALMADPAGHAEEIEQLTMIAALLTANNQLILGLKTGISGEGTETNPGLANGASALADQYRLIDEAIQDLPDMLDEMTGAMAQLKAGMDQLILHFSDLAGGIDGYLSGTLAIYQGFDSLCTAFADVVAGSSELNQNMSALYDGVRELSWGISLLHDETFYMDAEVQDQIDALFSDYTSGSFDVASFTSNKNTNVDSVQFVLMTDAIKIEKAEPEEEPESAGQTLWQRFLALF